MGQMKSLVHLDLRGCNIGDEVSIIYSMFVKLFVYCSVLIILNYQDVRTYVHRYVCTAYIYIYPDAWAFQ